MLIDFTDRTVLVTGAARGIGRGIVEGFAASGARVVATDVLVDPLERMAGEIQGLVEHHVLDVTDGAAVHALVGRVEPVAIDADDPLARVGGTDNAVVCRAEPLGAITVIGPGAGIALAGQGVLSDLVNVALRRGEP
jgi:NAD(P)-dependent dehydrogenase (short-subunit alcohol dehydrogenase family)